MKELQETLVSVTFSDSDSRRVALFLCRDIGNDNKNADCRWELRYQSWGEGVGWYTQATIPLNAQQLRDMRDALGPQMPLADIQRKKLKQPESALSWTPRVVCAESA